MDDITDVNELAAMHSVLKCLQDEISRKRERAVLLEQALSLCIQYLTSHLPSAPITAVDVAWAKSILDPRTFVPPPPEAIAAAKAEGAQAAEERRSFNDYCPYTYNRFMGDGMSTEEFQVTKRPLLDAWFGGWKGWLDERGLQFDFNPRGHSKIKATARQKAGRP